MKLRVVEELLWSIQEFLATFSNRGWVKRLPASEGLAAIFNRLLDSLMQLGGRQLLQPDLVSVNHGSCMLPIKKSSLLSLLSSDLIHFLIIYMYQLFS